jgi:tetratricopeptide (TPR) repeat protein
LGKESADEMLDALLSSGPPLPDQGAGRGVGIAPLKRLIIQRTEGNPFFMEEIVQTLFEQGVLARNGAVKLAKPLKDIRVPPTVQAILASRIDRLAAAEKELLQTLAVLGREFPSGLIKRVTGKPDAELERMLSELQLGEFIYEQPAMGDIEYTFKHALTQEVSYNSVLAERRRLLHERAGQAIEELNAQRLEDHLGELARHYDRSGNMLKAVEYQGRAGQQAADQTAHSEAIGYFIRALELLRGLPDSLARDSQELDLQMALSWSLFVAIGLQAPQRETALVRACELGEKLGENAKLMEALSALAHFRFNWSDFELGRELAERVLAMAQQADAPAMLPGAHCVLGMIRHATGQFASAREHFERAVELFAAGSSRSYGAFFYQIARAILCGTLLVLGYPETSIRKRDELLADARRSADPSSIAYALVGDLLNHVVLRDTRTVAERADEMLSIATEHGLVLHMLVAPLFRGWAMAAAGRGEEGIAVMRQTISHPMVAEASSTALVLVALAETCGRNGRAEEGLDWVAKGLARAEQIGLRTTEAELHRVKGELLMIKDLVNVTETEHCLRTAIDVARRQGARLFELRATVSLARLLKQQGETEQARQMLIEIYNWFTEGFELPDLKDAKALLEEMGGSTP